MVLDLGLMVYLLLLVVLSNVGCATYADMLAHHKVQHERDDSIYSNIFEPSKQQMIFFLLIPPLGVGYRGSLTSPAGALYSAARIILIVVSIFRTNPILSSLVIDLSLIHI